jgi:hypothetical protein
MAVTLLAARLVRPGIARALDEPVEEAASPARPVVAPEPSPT